MPRPVLTPEQEAQIARTRQIRALMKRPWILAIERAPAWERRHEQPDGSFTITSRRARWALHSMEITPPLVVEHRSLPTAVRHYRAQMRAWLGAALDNGREIPEPTAMAVETVEGGKGLIHGYAGFCLLDEIEMAGSQAASEAAKLVGLKKHTGNLQVALGRKRAALREQTIDKNDLRAILQEIAPGLVLRWGRCKAAQRAGALPSEFRLDSIAALARAINTLEPAGDALDPVPACPADGAYTP